MMPNETTTMGLREFVHWVTSRRSKGVKACSVPASFDVSLLVSFGGCVAKSLLELVFYPGQHLRGHAALWAGSYAWSVEELLETDPDVRVLMAGGSSL